MSWKYAPIRTSRALAPIRSAAASAIVPTAIEWLCVPGARRTSSWRSGWVMSPSSSRLIPVTIPNAGLDERQDPAQEEPGHQAPAGPPEAVGGDQARSAARARGPVAQVSTA